MNPWERRLKDLAMLLGNCEKTYFEPELFRMNANQFLQTSRTVTFLIQKNKSSIPRFDDWYKKSVVEAWSKDVVMTWAKNSRNKIEKKGDIEYLSSVTTTLISSYFENEDLVLRDPDENLIRANIKKLTKIARAKLTPAAIECSVIRIQREWIATSLPTWELLQAFVYIYSRQYAVCSCLSQHIDIPMEKTVPDAMGTESSARESRQIVYVTLSDGVTGRFQVNSIARDPEYKVENEKSISTLKKIDLKQNSIDEAVKQHSEFAKTLFDCNGVFYPTVFMHDESGQCIYQGGTVFSGQSDKYMYWRLVADQVLALSPSYIVWISENWIRDYTDKIPWIRFSDREIIGEMLKVTVLSSTLEAAEGTFEITRDDEETPTLSECRYSFSSSKILRELNILAPVVSAFYRLRSNQTPRTEG